MKIENTGAKPIKVTYKNPGKAYGRTSGTEGSPYTFDEVFIASGDSVTFAEGVEFLSSSAFETMEGNQSGVEVFHVTPEQYAKANQNGPASE
jgi:hypothetical protein